MFRVIWMIPKKQTHRLEIYVGQPSLQAAMIYTLHAQWIYDPWLLEGWLEHTRQQVAVTIKMSQRRITLYKGWATTGSCSKKRFVTATWCCNLLPSAYRPLVQGSTALLHMLRGSSNHPPPLLCLPFGRNGAMQPLAVFHAHISLWAIPTIWTPWTG